MNREILFRGKSIGIGVWLYGHLFNYGLTAPSNVPCISVCVPKSWKEACILYAVSPDTIGQYTGLTDKNGVKIFEGDVVHLKGDGYAGAKIGKDYYRVVTFHEGSFCLSIEDGVHYPLHTPIYEHSDSHNIVNWDVIGNVTDNPELIK